MHLQHLPPKVKELLTPLQLDRPKSTTHPHATGVVWPLESSILYLFGRPMLMRPVFHCPRGCVPYGGQFLDPNHHLLRDHGLLVPVPCRLSGGLANCHGKQMPALGILWKCLFEIHNTTTHGAMVVLLVFQQKRSNRRLRISASFRWTIIRTVQLDND